MNKSSMQTNQSPKRLASYLKKGFVSAIFMSGALLVCSQQAIAYAAEDNLSNNTVYLSDDDIYKQAQSKVLPDYLSSSAFGAVSEHLGETTNPVSSSQPASSPETPVPSAKPTSDDLIYEQAQSKVLPDYLNSSAFGAVSEHLGKSVSTNKRVNSVATKVEKTASKTVTPKQVQRPQKARSNHPVTRRTPRFFQPILRYFNR